MRTRLTNEVPISPLEYAEYRCAVVLYSSSFEKSSSSSLYSEGHSDELRDLDVDLALVFDGYLFAKNGFELSIDIWFTVPVCTECTEVSLSSSWLLVSSRADPNRNAVNTHKYVQHRILVFAAMTVSAVLRSNDVTQRRVKASRPSNTDPECYRYPFHFSWALVSIDQEISLGLIKRCRQNATLELFLNFETMNF